MIVYEYPLNERIRTLMRLEDLFARFEHFAAQDEALEHHAALLSLFEALQVARGDLKSDLIQELERQKAILEPLRNNPGVKQDTLDEVLTRINRTVGELQAMPGKLGQHLRDNEWVMSIKQRASIPGGVCEFDLPSYHYWLNLDAEVRRQDLYGWLAPFQPLCNAIDIVLQILRDSGEPVQKTAPHGAYQQMLSGRVAQMLRVTMLNDLPCFPEISANKYAINIRFTTLDGTERPKACDLDVPFELTLCSL
ncbi:MAG: cell division protein ZapD [Burkholderiales bacterium]|nr:cell division protein ZapD [Burkholderiales bacterium]